MLRYQIWPRRMKVLDSKKISWENFYKENPYLNTFLLEEDLQGWVNSGAVMRDLIKEIKPKIIVEVGCWKGLSTLFMANCLKKYNLLDSRIIAIDSWSGSLEHWDKSSSYFDELKIINGRPSIYQIFMSNVLKRNYDNVIIPLPLPSTTASRLLRREEIQPNLIYIDGSHEYKDVLRDLEDYFPLLAQGGVLFGDDFSMSGVNLAVNQFIDENPSVVLKFVEPCYFVLKEGIK